MVTRPLVLALALFGISCPAQQAAEPFRDKVAIVTGDVILVYVALDRQDRYYKIHRLTGEVWICAGNIGEPDFYAVEPCRGLDGSNHPLALFGTPRF